MKGERLTPCLSPHNKQKKAESKEAKRKNISNEFGMRELLFFWVSVR